VEARTSEVFAGACVVNGEAATTGREALLAWRVDQGRFNGVTLDGLAIVAAVILPQGFALKRRDKASADRALPWVATAGALLLVIARAIMPLTPSDNEANPWKLIAAVPPELRNQPVLNGYSMGGPLILSGIRPYVDGRGDMYGDALVIGYSRIAHGDERELDAAVRRWNIRWAILPNDSKPLIALLDRSPQWRRIASDKVGVVYVRSTPNA